MCDLCKPCPSCVEVVGADGEVHYRRPQEHSFIKECWGIMTKGKPTGYSLRCPITPNKGNRTRR
jgi:hypothetical protein